MRVFDSAIFVLTHLPTTNTGNFSVMNSIKHRSQGGFRKAVLFVVAFLMLAVSAELSAATTKVVKPRWISPNNFSTDTGEAKLEWEFAAGEPAEFFKLQEKFQRNKTIGYVTGRELNIYRMTPGQYRFRISACVRDVDGLPECGAYSRVQTVIVSEAIYDPFIEAANDEETIDKALVPTAAFGGPGELRPGSWYNPDKSGHGWSFFWAKPLAPSSNPQNTHDLFCVR